MECIGDAQGFSDNTPITPSRGFSVETLTRVTPSWKTELNRSISAMEDGIPRWLQHRYKVCCEKDGCCRRQACRFWEMILLQRCSFWTSELAYNSIPSLELSLQSPIRLFWKIP